MAESSYGPLALGANPFCHVLGFLDGADALRIFQCSQHFVAARDEVDVAWRQLLEREYGVRDLSEAPPSFFDRGDGEDAGPPTARKTWLHWRRAFRNYPCGLVRRFREVWGRLHGVLRQEAPEALEALRPGADEAVLDRLEERLNTAGQNARGTPEWRRLAPVLRLHLRFHDGQEMRPPQGMRGCYLPGSYGFYNRHADGRFLSCAEIETQMRGEHFHLRGFGRYGRERHFATPFVCFQAADRLHVATDATGTLPHGNVFTVSVAESMAPCESSHPATTTGDGLLLWLEEYARRVAEGIYRFEPSPVCPGWRILSLFPRPPRSAPVPDSEAAYLDGQVTTRITRGVRVDCSARICPEHRSHGVPGEGYLHAYSVTISMADDHPSRPVRLRQAQLKSRHWRIRKMVGTGLPEEERVDGEGVVGLFPIVAVGTGRSTTYESCTFADTDGVTGMGGFFTFVEGTIESPTGPEFDVAVQPFSLARPAFIY